VPGTVLSQCGPDEWDVLVEAGELATPDDGTPAMPGTPEDELCYPACFRDASELRPAAGRQVT
jgi:hypothetical protein